jgi:fructose-1,6-bisphosphatase/inositol monophosphatase family enzyme
MSVNTEVPENNFENFLTQEEAAWTFDRRGSLTVSLKNRRHADGELHLHYHPRYRVVDEDLAALELLRAQFGGTLYRHSRQHWSWEIGQSTLATVLEDVLPYMRLKRRHAELVLELIAVKEDGNDRAAQRVIVEELRWLNGQN